MAINVKAFKETLLRFLGPFSFAYLYMYSNFIRNFTFGKFFLLIFNL